MQLSEFESLMQTGVRLHQAGDAAAAESVYRRALTAYPDNPDALHLLGMIAYQRSEFDSAKTMIAKACRLNPTQALFYFNLARVAQSQGDSDEAIGAYSTAISLQPDFLEAVLQNCNCLLAVGRWQDALPHLENARRLRPGDPAIGFAQASALLQVGRLEDAENALADTVRLAPGLGAAWLERGKALILMERWQDAIAALGQAVVLMPLSAEVHFHLGIAYDSSFQKSAALDSYRRAIQVEPTHRRARFAHTCLLSEQGDSDIARLAFEELERDYPDSIAAFLKATMLSNIPPSAEAMAQERARLSAAIEQLRHDGFRLTDPMADGFRTPFLLAYHDAPPKGLLVDIAMLLRQACPDLSYVAPHCQSPTSPAGRRIRVGFVSHYLHDHTIGRLLARVITGIGRDRFEVHCFRFSQPRDATSRFVAENCERHHVIPCTRDGRDLIAAQALDALIYLDIGMDQFTYLCAFSRLAPIQCVAWGHPLTTGIDTLDFFISSVGQEGADPEARYSERPVLLESPLYFYEKPAPPPMAGLPEMLAIEPGTHVYLCPQTPFKLHPDFDRILAEILERDPVSIVLLVEADRPKWSELLANRFATNCPSVAARIRIIPRLARNEYLQLLAAAPVILDTRPFGGGLTTLDALAMGTPIITWPGDTMASRFTASCYARMGFRECVAGNADEYVHKACAIANDTSLRARMSAQIIASHDVLYSNPAPIRELEHFIQSAVTRT